VVEPFTDVALAPAAQPLRHLIESYIGYHYRGFAPGIHRGLPGRQLTFIISLDGPVDVLDLPGPRRGPASFDAFVGGLAAGPAVIRHDGTQYGVGIELTPLGARSMFGMPAGALAGEVVELDELLGRSAVELRDRMATAPDWSARFRVLDEVLTRTLRDAEPPAPEIVHAWRALSARDGAISVNELAEEIGWSRRHLSERFRDEIGLTPKVTARIMRFEQAKLLLRTPGRPGLADVAAQCGYYDQAHMNREWNELAGCSPTVWMAEELPSVQDTLERSGAS
jgi:AraC-like DNA-binding protein